jgi:hypothetical protein
MVLGMNNGRKRDEVGLNGWKGGRRRVKEKMVKW